MLLVQDVCGRTSLSLHRHVTPSHSKLASRLSSRCNSGEGTALRIRLKGHSCIHTQPRRLAVCSASNYDKTPELEDRLAATLPYLLPLLDSFPYGHYLMEQYPYVERALAPLFPLAYLYNVLPFLPFIVFLGVYSGIVNNYNFSRFVRYNALQAVLLDILLIIPGTLLGSTFKPPSEGLGLSMYMSADNTVFLFVAVSVAYGMGSCLVGQTPRLPLVASAADYQIRDGPSQ